MVARRIEITQEQAATQTVAAILHHRAGLLEATALVTRLALHLQVAPAKLMGKICYKGSRKLDSKRNYDAKQKAAIHKRDKGICFHCDEAVEVEDCHIDHIIPHTYGGKTTNHNGVCSCAHCNTSRGSKLRFTPKGQ